MPARTYLVGLTFIIKTLCHYYVKYSAQIISHVEASGVSSAEKALIIAFLGSAEAACVALREITGY